MVYSISLTGFNAMFFFPPYSWSVALGLSVAEDHGDEVCHQLSAFERTGAYC